MTSHRAMLELLIGGGAGNFPGTTYRLPGTIKALILLLPPPLKGDNNPPL